MKKCGVCGRLIENSLLECPQCGSGIFESKKVERHSKDHKVTTGINSDAKITWVEMLCRAIRRKKKEDITLSSFARDLLSPDIELRDSAINRARLLSRQGNRDGLNALEEAIRYKHGGRDIKFHTPGMLFMKGEDPLFETSPDELRKLAMQRLLWKTSPQKIQLLFSLATTLVNPVSLLNEINELGGDEQAMAIQLYGTHLIVQATLGKM